MTGEEHEQRIKRIEQLRDCPGWTEYLRPRISERLREIERDAMENEALSADKVMLLRAEAKALRGLLALPETDLRVSVAAARGRG